MEPQGKREQNLAVEQQKGDLSAGEPVVYTGSLPASGQSKPRFELPWKFIVMVLAALAVLAVAVLAVRSFIGRGQLKEQETVELVYWGIWHDEAAMQVLISEYEAKTGVKVAYIKQDTQDYRERLLNSLARAAGPDIFQFHNSWGVIFPTQLSGIPPEVMNISTYQDSFYPTAAVDLRRGQELIGVPLWLDGLGLYVNMDVFTAEGKSIPATWNDLVTTAVQLTKYDKDGRITRSGVALGSVDNVDHWQDIVGLMLLQNRADPANPEGEVAEGALRFFLRFSQQDKVWDDTLPASTQAFAKGQVAMYFAPAWRATEIKRANPGLAFKVVPVPQLPKITPSESDVNWASYWAEGVASGSKNKRQAWEFIKFLSSKESLQKLYAAEVRRFAPSRVDMASLVSDDPLMGAFVKQASTARSWYLASYTFDGPTGVNSRVASHYEQALTELAASPASSQAILEKLHRQIQQLLAEYSTTR